MKQDSWIDEVLEITNGIPEVEVNPALFQKIKLNIEHQVESYSSRRNDTLRMLLLAFVIISLNLSVIIHYHQNRTTSKTNVQTSSSLNLDSSTNYQY